MRRKAYITLKKSIRLYEELEYSKFANPSIPHTNQFYMSFKVSSQGENTVAIWQRNPKDLRILQGIGLIIKIEGEIIRGLFKNHEYRHMEIIQNNEWFEANVSNNIPTGFIRYYKNRDKISEGYIKDFRESGEYFRLKDSHIPSTVQSGEGQGNLKHNKNWFYRHSSTNIQDY